MATRCLSTAAEQSSQSGINRAVQQVACFVRPVVVGQNHVPDLAPGRLERDGSEIGRRSWRLPGGSVPMSAGQQHGFQDIRE